MRNKKEGKEKRQWLYSLVYQVATFEEVYFVVTLSRIELDIKS